MDKHIQKTCEDLGFLDYTDVSGSLSIADLFRKSDSRCGIYLLVFENGLYYIGQSIDVVKRFTQHRKRHPNISEFSFQAVVRSKLDSVEQELIRKAQSAEVPLINKEYMVDAFEATDFDELVSPREQLEWIGNLRTFDDEAREVKNEGQRLRYTQEYNRFLAHPLAGRSVELLKVYVRKCIPAFRRTERTFWSLTCLPSTNANTWPRLACVNMYTMETFVVGYYKEASEVMWCFVNLGKSTFLKHHSLATIKRKYPGIDIRDANYQAVRDDGLTVQASEKDMLKLFGEPGILDAARELNLRLMRKGATVLYARYHCFHLADQVI